MHTENELLNPDLPLRGQALGNTCEHCPAVTKGTGNLAIKVMPCSEASDAVTVYQLFIEIEVAFAIAWAIERKWHPLSGESQDEWPHARLFLLSAVADEHKAHLVIGTPCP